MRRPHSNGLPRVFLLIALASSAACGTSRTPASPSPENGTGAAAAPAPAPVLRIGGLPSALQRGTSATLTAELVSSSGVSDCSDRARWQTDNLAVASVSDKGVLTGLLSGFATVTASCDSVSASGQTAIQAPAPRLWMFSCDPVPSGGTCNSRIASDLTSANATIEFLDGVRAGERLPESALGAIPRNTLTFPMRIRMTARFYEPTDFVLAESTAMFRTSSDVSFVVPMTFVGDASTDAYVRDISVRKVSVFPFRSGSAGLIEVGTYYNYGPDAHYVHLPTELWCDGTLLAKGGEEYGWDHAGPLFARSVSAPGACEVRVTEQDAFRYRLTITYPH